MLQSNREAERVSDSHGRIDLREIVPWIIKGSNTDYDCPSFYLSRLPLLASQIKSWILCICS